MDDVRETAEFFGIDAQADGEPDQEYRRRVAGELRSRGKIIEAQEVLMGRRWDDPDQGPLTVLDGVTGGILSTMGVGPRLSPDPARRVEEEAMLGAVFNEPPDPAREALARAFDALGPAGLDLMLGGR